MSLMLMRVDVRTGPECRALAFVLTLTMTLTLTLTLTLISFTKHKQYLH